MGDKVGWDVDGMRKVARAEVARITSPESVARALKEADEILKVTAGPFGQFTSAPARAYWQERARLLRERTKEEG